MDSGNRCNVLNMELTKIKAIPSLRFDNILLLWSEAVPAGASHCLELYGIFVFSKAFSIVSKFSPA